MIEFELLIFDAIRKSVLESVFKKTNASRVSSPMRSIIAYFFKHSNLGNRVLELLKWFVGESVQKSAGNFGRRASERKFDDGEL